MMQMQRFGLHIAPASDPPGVGFAQFRRDRPLDRSARTRRNCLATTPLIGGCAPLRIEFLSAATFPSLFEKGGAENDAGFKTQSVRGALAVGKRAQRRKVMTTIYQGICARCERRVRTDENHLKGHLWASTAVFHWDCFIALMKEHSEAPATDVLGKASRVMRG